MTKKITEETIKKLVEEVLKEEQLNEKKTKFVTRNGKGVFDDGKWDSITAARKDLGWDKKPTETDWGTLANIVDEPEVDGVQPLSFDDLKAASSFKTGIKRSAFNTLNQDLKTAVLSGGSTDDEEEEIKPDEEEETNTGDEEKEETSTGDTSTGPGTTDIQHPKIGKIRARKLNSLGKQNKQGYVVSTETKSVSSNLLNSVYSVGDYDKLFADATNSHNFSTVLKDDGYEGAKNFAPILYFNPRIGVFTEATLKQFLKDVGDKLASGGIEREYSAADLPDLFKQNDSDQALLATFETELAKIFKLPTLKGLTEVASALEIGDFDFLFDNFEVQFKQALEGGGDAMTPEEANTKLKQFRKLLVDTYKQAQGSELKKALASLLASSKATGSARATMGASSGYRITSRSASGGSVDSQIIKAFDNAFDMTGTFNERVETFNTYMAEINTVIADADNAKVSGDIKDQFSKFIVLDLLQQIMYDFEASSAGWVFESWLAFMGFGSAIGAGYGAGDFTIREGGKTYEGSAKLLQKGTTSQNFEDVDVNQTIKYVIGVKQTKVGDKFQGTTQKDRVGKLDIYLVDITKTSDTATKMVHNGTNIGTPPIVEGRIEIKIPKGTTPDATLDLLFLQENEFQDVSGIIVKNMSDKLSQAMNTMSSLKANIDEYVLSFDKGDERQIYSDGARDDFNSLSDILKMAGDKQIFGVDSTATTFQEGKKITSNFLKKLIAESFKK